MASHQDPPHATSIDTHCASLPPDMLRADEEQIGGGRRAPSPPPVHTPTRLRTVVKATSRDSGLVRDAQMRRQNLDHPQPTGDSEEPQPMECASVLFRNTTEEYLPFPHEGRGPVLAETTDRPLASKGDARPPGSNYALSPNIPPVSSSRGSHPQILPRRVVPLPELCDLRTALVEATVHRHAERMRTEGMTALGVSQPLAVEAPEKVPETEEEDADTPRQNVYRTPTPGPALLTVADFDTCIPDCPNSPSPRRPTPDPFIVSAANLADGEPSSSTDNGFAVGRTPSTTSAILDEAFEKIYNDFSELSGRVRMPLPQVVQRFTKQFARTISWHPWNSYQRFWRANKAQELARLKNIDLVHATPTQQMTQCYKYFREEYPDNWQEILATFDDADALNDEDKTVAQRQALFYRLAKQQTQALASMSKAHAFEAVLIMAGGVVNQDAALGSVYATTGAEKFFLERCRADDNDILGHFKAHIYNKLSLAHVAMAFNGPATEPQEVQASKQEGEPDEEVLDIPDDDEREDHARVRSAFVRALVKVGCQWAAKKLFPWKAMPSKLAKSSVVCHNFPDTVMLPGKERLPRTKAGSKGISDLTLAECSTLISAFNDTPTNSLRFECVPKMRADLISSRLPVIICGAPAYGSAHAAGRRLFADLRVDRKGVPRKENGAATRIKKKARPTPSREVLSLSDSDIEIVGKGKGKPQKLPDDLYESDDIQEVPPPTEEVERRSRPKRAVAQSPAVKIEKVDDEAEVEDLSSPSGSEYVPDADEKAAAKVVVQDDSQDVSSLSNDSSDVEAEPLPRKRKSKTDISSRAVKKRVVVELVSKSVLKGKRKASPSTRTSRKKRLIARASSASSGDEGTTSSKPWTSVKITEPDREDGPTNIGITEPVADTTEPDRKDRPTDDSVPVVAPTVEAPTPSSPSLPAPVVAPMVRAPAPSLTSLPAPVVSAPTPSTTSMPTTAMANPIQPPSVPVPSQSASERPKPRLVTKANRQDDHDAFSLRAKKRAQDASVTARETDALSMASANLLALEEGRIGSKGKDDSTARGDDRIAGEEDRVTCKSPALDSDSGSHSLDPCDGATASDPLVPRVEFPPRQSRDALPVLHERHAYVPQIPSGEHVPFMGGGWYGLPDPRMQGYGHFMPPWGAFPDMDNPARQLGYFPGAQMQGGYNGGPGYEGYKGHAYPYHGQPGKRPSQNLHAARRAPYPDSMVAGPSNADFGDYPNGYPGPAPNIAAPQDPVHRAHAAEGDE